jgi:hypothetical protein
MLLARMETLMPDLEKDIIAYETMRADLENHHLGGWVLVHNEELIGVFPSFENAASVAAARFGRGPYLIRQIGASPVIMPASVVYNLQHA